MIVTFAVEDGPVIVRRVASVTSDVVTLRIEQGGGEHLLTATWRGDHFDLRPGALITDALRPQLPRVVRTPERLVVGPALSLKKLETSFINAVSADAASVVVSGWSSVGEFDGDLQRVDRYSGAVTPLRPRDRKLSHLRLGMNGRRAFVVQHSEERRGGELACTVDVLDLVSGGSTRLPDKVVPATEPTFILISDDGDRTAVAGIRSSISILDATLHLIDTVPCERSDALSLRGRYLARFDGGGSRTIAVFDCRTRRWSSPLEAPSGTQWITVSPDGKLVFCGGTSNCVLDVATGTMVMALQLEDVNPSDAVFSPDSQWLLVSGGSVCLVDLSRPETWRVLRDAPLEGEREYNACFTPDGRHDRVSRPLTRLTARNACAGARWQTSADR